MEKKTIEVIVGKPVTGTVDPAKLGTAVSAPPKAGSEVGGRDVVYEAVVCPSDGAICWIWVDTERWNYYTCWRDGYVFRA